MNLLDKSLRQLLVLAVALIFFSCEDETSILGYRNPNPKFKVSYIEIPLSSTVVVLDSLITDNGIPDATIAVLAGSYLDNAMGAITAQPYVQPYPVLTSKLNETAVYDSATVHFRLNFYSYGFTGEQTLKFSVHELSDTLSYSNGNRYYAHSAVPYSTAELAEVAVRVKYDSLQANRARQKQDTVLLEGRLDDSYGQQLFEIAKSDPNSSLTNFKTFKSLVRGLTLLPKEQNGIIGLNLLSGFSRITIHYHTLETSGAVRDTLTRNFPLDHSGAYANTAFTNIQGDRSGTDLAGAIPFQGFDPMNRYLQSGAPVITKVDLTNFYNFADTIENILINSAELVIEDVESPDGLQAHSGAMLRIMNANDRFIKRTNKKDSLEMLKYYVLGDGISYNVYADNPSSALPQALISYKGSKDEMSGFISLFAQTLFRHKLVDEKTNPNRITYIGIFPYSPTMAKSVSRTIFEKNKVKLKIHYTKPTQLTP